MRPTPSARTAAVILFAAVPLVAVGCDKPDNLPHDIDTFEQNRARVLERMHEAEERYASGGAPADPAETAAFAEEWKGHWDDIEAEVKKLKRELDRVQKAGDKQLRKMDEVAKSINDRHTRANELAKNADLARRWSITMQVAKANVKKMEGQVVAARDIYKVLKLASMRSKTENKMAEIRALNGQVKATLTELEQVTAEGRALVR
jgi:hypothetical protein